MYPGIYSGLTYQEWKEVSRKAKAKRKMEAFREFVESIRDSAIFLSRKCCGRKSIPGYGLPRYGPDFRGIVKRIAEIVVSVLFFAVLIGGLNVLAILL